MDGTHEHYVGDDGRAGTSDRAFGLVFAAAFTLVAIWPVWRGGTPRGWAAGLSLAFLVAALLIPRALSPLNRLWTRLGFALHAITNPIVMGAVFFLVVTPTALLLRLLGKDPLRLKKDEGASSYWIERTPPGPDSATMTRQF